MILPYFWSFPIWIPCFCICTIDLPCFLTFTMVIPLFWKIYHGNTMLFGHASLKYHVFEPWNYHVFQHVPLQSNVFWTFTTVISSFFDNFPCIWTCTSTTLLLWTFPKLMPCFWACSIECLLDMSRCNTMFLKSYHGKTMFFAHFPC